MSLPGWDRCRKVKRLRQPREPTPMVRLIAPRLRRWPQQWLRRKHRRRRLRPQRPPCHQRRWRHLLFPPRWRPAPPNKEHPRPTTRWPRTPRPQRLPQPRQSQAVPALVQCCRWQRWCSGSASSTCNSRDRGGLLVRCCWTLVHPRLSTHSGGDCLRSSSSNGRHPFGEIHAGPRLGQSLRHKDSGTKHHVQERKKKGWGGGTGGDNNGATKLMVHWQKRNETPRSARALAALRGDGVVHRTLKGPSWTLWRWLLSAWACCHVRLFRSHLHPITLLACHTIFLFFSLLRARRMFLDEKILICMHVHRRRICSKKYRVVLAVNC